MGFMSATLSNMSNMIEQIKLILLGQLIVYERYRTTDLLSRVGFELTSSGFWTAALPIKLSRMVLKWKELLPLN